LRDLVTAGDVEQPEGQGEQHRQWLELLHTHNVIGSWVRLPGVDIIMFGTSKSCEVVSSGLDRLSLAKTRCLPIPCVNEDYQAPQYDCIFAQAANLSLSDNIM